MLRHYALRIEQEVAISLLFSNGQRHTSESALPLVSICRTVLVLTGKLSYRKEPCYTKLPSANALKRSARACRTGSFLFSCFFVCLLQDTDDRTDPRKCYRHQKKMCEGCKHDFSHCYSAAALLSLPPDTAQWGDKAVFKSSSTATTAVKKEAIKRCYPCYENCHYTVLHDSILGNRKSSFLGNFGLADSQQRLRDSICGGRIRN